MRQRATTTLSLNACSKGYFTYLLHQAKYFVLYSFFVYLMIFYKGIAFELFVPNIQLLLKTRTY